MRKHEHMGLLLIFIGAAWLGWTFYTTLLIVNGISMGLPAPTGLRWALIPIFYGLGATIFMLGTIEIKELLPGKNRYQ